MSPQFLCSGIFFTDFRIHLINHLCAFEIHRFEANFGTIRNFRQSDIAAQLNNFLNHDNNNETARWHFASSDFTFDKKITTIAILVIAGNTDQKAQQQNQRL